MRFLLWIAEEQSARLAPDLREALASLAHRGRVDDGQQLFNVVRDKGVEQGLVVVLQIAHQAVFAEGGSAMIERDLAPLALIFKAADVRRKQAVQAEGVALCFSKCGSFVEARIHEQIESRQASTNHGGVAAVRRGSLFDSKFFSLLFLYDSQIPWRAVLIAAALVTGFPSSRLVPAP